MNLTDRDYLVLKEVHRWRCILGRHIKDLCGFSSARACDRRLKILIEAGYLERKKMLYGLPYIYSLTSKGKTLTGVNKYINKIRIEQVTHDMAVIDTVIYYLKKYNLQLSDIISEKELHSMDGFEVRKHKPDFMFTKDNTTYAVEIEFTLKAKNLLVKNIASNYLTYDQQIWIVPSDRRKILKILEGNTVNYPNIMIEYLEVIKNA